MNGPEDPVRLNYEPVQRRPSLRVPRWVWVGLLVVVLLAAVIGVGRPAYVTYRERKHKESLIRQVHEDLPGPEVIAYEDDLVRAAPLIGKSGYVTINGWDNKPRAARVPRAWFELRYECWGWWDAAPDEPILFSHVRTTSRSAKRVVIVHAKPTWPNGNTRVRISAILFDAAADAWSIPSRWDSAAIDVECEKPERGKGFRIYAGQADAKDSSRFTIDYESNGSKHRIIGVLRDGTITSREWTEWVVE